MHHAMLYPQELYLTLAAAVEYEPVRKSLHVEASLEAIKNLLVHASEGTFCFSFQTSPQHLGHILHRIVAHRKNHNGTVLDLKDRTPFQGKSLLSCRGSRARLAAG